MRIADEWMDMKDEALLEDLLAKISNNSTKRSIIEKMGSEVYDNAITFSQLAILLDK